jgi:hypothetical protein
VTTYLISRVRFALVVFAALWLAACAQGQAAQCEIDGDCAADQSCQSGTCAPRCATDADCPQGRLCESGVCLLPARCQSSDDCRIDEVCDNRVCVRQISECEADRDCPPGQRCDGGGCVPAGLTDLECVTRGDCAPGESCVDNRCISGVDVALPDIEDAPDAEEVSDTDAPDAGETTSPSDVPPDVPIPPEDVELDTPEVADIAVEIDVDPDVAPVDVADVIIPPDVDVVEPECEDLFDCADDELCEDGECVPYPVCEGRDDGVLGDSCTGASGCCNGLCLGNPSTGAGFCTQTCDSFVECNPVGSPHDMFCLDAGAGAGRLCAFSDYGDSCAVAADCLGQACMVSNSSRSCTWQCRTGRDCPSGSACGLVPFGSGPGAIELRVCTPVGSRCINFTDCLSGTCLTDDNPLNNYCTTFCSPTDPDACPLGYTCGLVEGVRVCLRGS